MAKSNIRVSRDQSPWGNRLSLAEAAGFLRVGISTLQKRMADGTGPKGEKFLGRWEFELPELTRWRQAQGKRL